MMLGSDVVILSMEDVEHIVEMLNTKTRWEWQQIDKSGTYAQLQNRLCFLVQEWTERFSSQADSVH
jgi:hypothetical protein